MHSLLRALSGLRFFVRCYPALQTDAGWFLLPEVASLNAGVAEILGVNKFELRDVGPGAAPELLLETDIAFSRHTAEYSSGSSSTELRICGIGKSGKPSCTAPIEVGGAESSRSHDHEEPADDQPPEPYSEHLSVWRSKISFLPDGRVQVEDSSQAGRSNPLRGTHTLTFP